MNWFIKQEYVLYIPNTNILLFSGQRKREEERERQREMKAKEGIAEGAREEEREKGKEAFSLYYYHRK